MCQIFVLKKAINEVNTVTEVYSVISNDKSNMNGNS
jgi:hypothetical protein